MKQRRRQNKASPEIDPFKTREFKGLQKLWTAKLEESGFKDIEDLTNGCLKTWDSHYFNVRADDVELGREYYETAEHLLATHEFDSEIEKTIWALHCEGMSTREIEERVTQSKAYAWHLLFEKRLVRDKLNKDRINQTIQRLQKFIGRR